MKRTVQELRDWLGDKPRDAEVNPYEGERTGIVVVQRNDDGNESWFFETPDTYGYEPKQSA